MNVVELIRKLHDANVDSDGVLSYEPHIVVVDGEGHLHDIDSVNFDGNDILIGLRAKVD